VSEASARNSQASHSEIRELRDICAFCVATYGPSLLGYKLGGVLFLGWVTLSVGLLGTRLPRAVPASVLASLMLNLAGLEILSRVVFLIGLAWLGVIVLKMRDEAWLASERDEGLSA